MRRGIIIAASVTGALVVTAAPALAGKGGGKAESTITLVTLSPSLASADAQAPHQGDAVAFEVSTTATDRPYILLNCFQGAVWAYSGQGFQSASLAFTLASSVWTSGAAECTARLGALNADGTRFRELASTSFHVDA